MEMHIVVPLKQCLANMPVEGHWLQCVVCRRFFHADSGVVDHTRTPRCPFPDCSGRGYHFDLPPDTEELDDQRARRRHATLVDAFERSAERAALGDAPLRFLEPFLWMQYCCSGDPDDDFFAEDFARGYVRDVHRWADADEIDDYAATISELLAFWAFADRTALLASAPEWHALLQAMAAGR